MQDIFKIFAKNMQDIFKKYQYAKIMLNMQQDTCQIYVIICKKYARYITVGKYTCVEV